MDEMKNMLLTASDSLKMNREILCSLDAVAGDGDHGITVAKMADCIADRVRSSKEGESMKKILQDIADSLMNVNGGSAGPLWGTIFEGMAESVESDALDESGLKAMFLGARRDFEMISRAKVGDKTLVDAFYPAVEAMAGCQGNIEDILRCGAEASKTGAELTANFAARFGRAKNVGDRSIGHKDPGAVSISILLDGFYRGYAGLD
jgi:dihydroxyacetone kinase-like protein